MSGKTKLSVETLDDGLNFLRNWIPETHQGLSWGILMLDDEGGYTAHTRFYQPCYGEMRPYGKGSDRPQDSKPGDLHDPFPKGTPVAVAVPWAYNSSYLIGSELLKVVLNPETSPWRAVLQDFELLDKGLILKDTEIDPTLMVNLFMFLRDTHAGKVNRFKLLREQMPEANPNVHLLMCNMGDFGTAGFDYFLGGTLGWSFDYILDPRLSVKRFVEGDFVRLSGDTFRNRSAYNRPELDDVFGVEFPHIAKRLKEKGITAGATIDDAAKVYEYLSQSL